MFAYTIKDQWKMQIQMLSLNMAEHSDKSQ